MNWAWMFLRIAVGLTVLALLFLSQRFWYRAIWRFTASLSRTSLRIAFRVIYLAGLLAVILATIDGFRMGHRHFIPRSSMITALAGLWLSSAFFAYLAVKGVRGLDRLWQWFRRRLRLANAEEAVVQEPAVARVDALANPSRRYFFQSATAFAGAIPFLGAVYGFAAERLRYRIFRVEIPVANLPPGLDGLRIAQLSDIHLSGYMPREEVRRAVDMANELAADLTVVTGDFITGAGDPLPDCIDEIRALRAPLGIWGCNGNHEIYARAQDAAERLFRQAGMKLLRQENTQLHWRGASFNLIGVDYQRQRLPNGRRVPMLPGVERLVRRDMPNILLSHNPNAFDRAAELGIELTLSGHTHGGQVQVEILDTRLSPARFISDYIAGLYQRPLFSPAGLAAPSLSRASLLSPGPQITDHRSRITGHASKPQACIYVNRGLGTVGAPVRLGVPPEITLLVLRRA
jgi:predicted MPP superfamily phosphohydrolase